MCVIIVGEARRALIKLFQFSLMLHVELINVPSARSLEMEKKKIRWINLMLADHRLRNQTSSRQFSHSRKYVWFSFTAACFQLEAFQCTFGVESGSWQRERSWDVTFNYLQLLEFYSVWDFFALVICFDDECGEISFATLLIRKFFFLLID